MAELARIKKERAEEAARKAAEEAAERQKELQQEVATGNPLLNQPMDFQVRPSSRQLGSLAPSLAGLTAGYAARLHGPGQPCPSAGSCLRCHILVHGASLRSWNAAAAGFMCCMLLK